MIKNDIKSKYEEKISENYAVPDVRETRVTVTDALTHELNSKPSHTTYRVNTETTFPQYGVESCSVRRRYNDFVWLRSHLDNMIRSKQWKRPVEALPDLPGDTIASFFGWGRFEADFIEDRRKNLEEFINIIANHPQCCTDPGLINFLKVDDMEEATRSST
eukprot:TRINITY_DN5733_c0_g1_i1.p1 TRINITY_DN5733_c0_g1~~TRINITY_DN5733_c0_g1_i1.p1  ORF type:complete len:161 (+),score=50.90 TRINITY_DN5733_c0_g1_i1:77-559(+)